MDEHHMMQMAAAQNPYYGGYWSNAQLAGIANSEEAKAWNRQGDIAKLRGVPSDQDIKDLMARNEARCKQAQKALGPRWVLWGTRK